MYGGIIDSTKLTINMSMKQSNRLVNLPKDMQKEMNSMKREEMLCDVKLRVKDTIFSLQRIVLASASPYFRAMFRGNFKESKMAKSGRKGNVNNCITLHDMDEEGFKTVIDCIYSSTLKLTKENVCQVLAASHMLQISSIVDLCEGFMKENLTPSTYFEYQLFAESHQLDGFEDYFHEHFIILRETEDFQHLSKETLCRFLNSDLLQINHQGMEVFRAALQWQEFSPDRKKDINDIMNCVRFTMIPEETLAGGVMKCQYVADQGQDSELFPMILEALKFHAQPFSQPINEWNNVRGTDKILMLSEGKGAKKGYSCSSGSKLYGISQADISNDRSVHFRREPPPNTAYAFKVCHLHCG